MLQLVANHYGWIHLVGSLVANYYGWIHLVGSLVANYAAPIRPICLVTALQGPPAPASQSRTIFIFIWTTTSFQVGSE